MRFDVPFIPDPKYSAFLSERLDVIESVHFSLYSGLLADARPAVERRAALEVAEQLAGLFGPDKYLLANARFHDPSIMLDTQHMRVVGELLRMLLEGAELTGIIYADTYMLQAMAKAAPAICCHLEAVPSVNCILDHEDKVASHLQFVESLGFLPPKRIILDRELNRKPTELARVVAACRKRFPALRIGLLANEGCLPHCVHKPSHDSLGALGHIQGDQTFPVNREYGCIRTFLDSPWRMLTSPFIRPEDVHEYEDVADLIKVCGRNRGGRGYLENVVQAYLDGAYTGNLLALLDTLGEFEDRVSIPNHLLPEGFYDQVNHCERSCTDCDACRALYEEFAQERDVAGLDIPNYTVVAGQERA